MSLMFPSENSPAHLLSKFKSLNSKKGKNMLFSSIPLIKIFPKIMSMLDQQAKSPSLRPLEKDMSSRIQWNQVEWLSTDAFKKKTLSD